MFSNLKFLSAVVVACSAACSFANGYTQNNLVSNLAGRAASTDADLVNPWGMSYSPTGPFWVSDNGIGLSTLYNTGGVKQGLVVNIPGTAGGNGPVTGQVFNGSSAFQAGNSPAFFMFATEDGAIDGWNGGTSASVMVNNSGSGAIYKGLAINAPSGVSAADARLYAADFSNNAVQVFNGSMQQLSGLTDPNLPSGYAPFNVEVLNGSLFVSYAKQGGGVDEVDGLGLGFVDKFNLNGSFAGRLVSQGDLNAPWGMAIAPVGFGEFSGDLLVGNFGDGKIHAYDPNSGVEAGVLKDKFGNEISIDGLWDLKVGNGASGGDANKVYFTAGSDGEANGLFGNLATVPEPCSLTASILALGALLRRRRK